MSKSEFRVNMFAGQEQKPAVSYFWGAVEEWHGVMRPAPVFLEDSTVGLFSDK
jgi:hypothetical protein